ncbi:hypothetical protein ACB094_05G121300 [Castanea mollissima]
MSQNCAPHLSTQFFSLFGGAHSLHRSEGWFSLTRVLFSLLSPFTQNTVLPSYLHTHTHRKVCDFFFSFSFSILLPPYPEDPSLANSITEISTFSQMLPKLFYKLIKFINKEALIALIVISSHTHWIYIYIYIYIYQIHK